MKLMAMELEHPIARGLPMLLRPRILDRPSRGVWASRAAAESRLRATSLLSVAVQEMLVVHRDSLALKKPPRGGPARVPPGTGTGAVRSLMATAAEETPATRAVKAVVTPGARTRQALAKRVARRMLRRGASSSSSSPDHERRAVVLTCCCQRLPHGLRCPLHQHDPLPWTHGATAAGAGEAVVVLAPKADGHNRGAFIEYARWRRSVWMPSRFYLEDVDQTSSCSGATDRLSS